VNATSKPGISGSTPRAAAEVAETTSEACAAA